MARKFSSQRLYGLVKILVNVVSVINIILFIVIMLNYDKVQSQNLLFHDECMNRARGSQTYMSSCITVYLNANREHDTAVGTTGILGLGLPLLFYGGGALFRYLFPKKK